MGGFHFLPELSNCEGPPARPGEGQPARAIVLADRAHQRLSRRYRRMMNRGKPHDKVVVAVARERVRFLWATMASEESAA